MSRRRFAVIGLGSFGFHVARVLFEEGQDVLAIDRDPKVVEAVRPFCSASRLVDAADREALAGAGVSSVDAAVIGLGSRVDVSIIATMYLRELGVKQIVAKSVTEDHARVLRRIGASEVVRPEREVARRLAQRLVRPDVVEEIPFLEGFVLAEVRAPARLWGVPLARSGIRAHHHLAVVAMKRSVSGEVRSFPALPDQTIEKGDALVLLARPEDLQQFRVRFGL